MQTTDTIQQRLDCVCQRKARVTLADLLTAAHTPADLRSYAFQWAILKLAAKMDDKPRNTRTSNETCKPFLTAGQSTPEHVCASNAHGVAHHQC